MDKNNIKRLLRNQTCKNCIYYLYTVDKCLFDVPTVKINELSQKRTCENYISNKLHRFE
jgi:hypothetical protein